jgi:hypothetical protein
MQNQQLRLRFRVLSRAPKKGKYPLLSGSSNSGSPLALNSLRISIVYILVCELIREPVGSDDTACGGVVGLDGREAYGGLWGR